MTTVGTGVRVRVRIRFSVWLVSGYAHVFILLSFVIVTFPAQRLCLSCGVCIMFNGYITVIRRLNLS